jgi:hypothetical protein
LKNVVHIVGVYVGVAAVIAAPLATIVSRSWPAPHMSELVTFFVLFGCAIAAAALASCVIYLASAVHRFSTLEGLASAIVAWLLFAMLVAACCALLGGPESWVFGAFIGTYGLLFPPTWFVFAGGAFAGWLASRQGANYSLKRTAAGRLR